MCGLAEGLKCTLLAHIAVHCSIHQCADWVTFPSCHYAEECYVCNKRAFLLTFCYYFWRPSQHRPMTQASDLSFATKRPLKLLLEPALYKAVLNLRLRDPPLVISAQSQCSCPRQPLPASAPRPSRRPLPCFPTCPAAPPRQSRPRDRVVTRCACSRRANARSIACRQRRHAQ